MSVEKKGLPVPQPKTTTRPFFQVADGPGADIGLSHLAHLDGGLNPDLHPMLLQHVGHSQGVDGRGQHAHMVGPDPDHLVAAVFDAPPEISAAHDDAHLDAHIHTLFDRCAYRADHIKVQPAASVSGQGLAADFQQNALVDRVYSSQHNSFIQTSSMFLHLLNVF